MCNKPIDTGTIRKDNSYINDAAVFLFEKIVRVIYVKL